MTRWLQTSALLSGVALTVALFAGELPPASELEPGEYSLQLVLGDHLHLPHDPPVVSEQITVMVE